LRNEFRKYFSIRQARDQFLVLFNQHLLRFVYPVSKTFSVPVPKIKTDMKPTIVVLIVTGTLMSSCFETRYTYYLENETAYDIDSAVINVDHHFSLRSGEVTGPFEGTHSGNLASNFSEPLLTLFVSDFSDASVAYHNEYGCTRDMRIIEDNGTYIFRIQDAGHDAYGVNFTVDIHPMTETPPLASSKLAH
jgi:hypothetical protein